MSLLSAFTTNLVQFFEELSDTVPEEKSIKMATEAVKGAKKINPKLLLDLFYEHIYKDLKVPILERNLDAINTYGRIKIQGQFNEIMPAIAIFDKHWPSLSTGTQDAIWKYMKVLVVLCERLKEPSAGGGAINGGAM
jgi:hypothetical protein